MAGNPTHVPAISAPQCAPTARQATKKRKLASENAQKTAIFDLVNRFMKPKMYQDFQFGVFQ
jgi:hypothetical protein